jgi:hypothetical protein
MPPEDLTMTCLTYLNFDVFEEELADHESLTRRMSKYKFWYANAFWGYHTRIAEEYTEIHKVVEIHKTALGFLMSQNKRESMVRIRTQIGSRFTWKGVTVLHLLAENGLGLCEILLAAVINADGR